MARKRFSRNRGSRNAPGWIYSRSKYKAKPTTIDGIRFASRKEAMRYIELRDSQELGYITGLEIQVKFALHVKDKRIGHYIADFRYTETASWGQIVEDVKGFRTPLYNWKKKHFEAEYEKRITET